MKRLMVATALAATAAGCGDGGADDDALNADSVRIETPQHAAELLAPPRAVLVALIDYTDEARQRAVSEEVRQYAAVVSSDHRGAAQVIDSVAGDRNARIEQTQAAQELENTVRMAHAGLSGLEADDYDLAFVRAQVEAHRHLLDHLEHEATPAATSDGLRRVLEDLEATEAAHLSRARQILASLLGEVENPAGGGDTTPPPGPPGGADAPGGGPTIPPGGPPRG